jgi:SAM-dependent methyltransferase
MGSGATDAAAAEDPSHAERRSAVGGAPMDGSPGGGVQDGSAAFAIPTLVAEPPPPEGSSAPSEGHPAAAAHDPAEDGPDTRAPLEVAATEASAATSGGRRIGRSQRPIHRASGFIEVRHDAGASPDARGDAALTSGERTGSVPEAGDEVDRERPPWGTAHAADVGHLGHTEPRGGAFHADAADAADAAVSNGEGLAARHDVHAERVVTGAFGELGGDGAEDQAGEDGEDGEVVELDAEEAEIEEAELDDEESGAEQVDPYAEVAIAPAIVAEVAAVVSEATPAPPPPPERGRRRPWHEEIFTEGHARLELSRDEELVEREVEFVASQLGLPAGARILDVGAGVGHFAIGLGKRGYRATGVDSSLAVLLDASNRNEAAGNVAAFLHGDMRRLPDDESYDAVLCLGQTFGYFDDAENQLVLEQMRLRLAVGGQLLLQVRSRDHMVTHLPCRSWWQGPRCLVLDEGSFDPYTSRVRVQRTVVFEDGRQHEERSDVRVYAPHELVRMLAAVGLEVSRMFGSRLTPEHFFPSVSPEIWIVARRAS